MIQLKSISKDYVSSMRVVTNCLESVSFAINKGEICSLCGTSGSRKTTILTNTEPEIVIEKRILLSRRLIGRIENKQGLISAYIVKKYRVVSRKCNEVKEENKVDR